MKVFKFLLRLIGIVSIVIMSILILLYYVIYHAPMVPANYEEKVETGGYIEQKYLGKGIYEVKSISKKVEKPVDKYVVYYPKELESKTKKYPVIVIMNGTGVFANKEKALFEHLASWGFVVLGNYDPSTYSGLSADMTLNYLLELNEDKKSVFYNKIDIHNIGITGHSQGGVGVFNAIQIQNLSYLYKCAVSISPTEYEMAHALGMKYEYKDINIPIMLLAGTNNDVISQEALTKIFNEINETKVMGIRKNTDHGSMLYATDGYVTAWFMWNLQNDETASKAFIEDNAELLENELYQEQRIFIKDSQIPIS